MKDDIFFVFVILLAGIIAGSIGLYIVIEGDAIFSRCAQEQTIEGIVVDIEYYKSGSIVSFDDKQVIRFSRVLEIPKGSYVKIVYKHPWGYNENLYYPIKVEIEK